MATFNWGTLFFFNKALFTFSFFRKVKFNKVWVWIAECILLTTQLCKAEVTGLFKTQYLPWVQWNKARLKSGVYVCVCRCVEVSGYVVGSWLSARTVWTIQSATHGLLRARGWVEVGSNLHAVCREVSYHCSVQGGVLSILHCTAVSTVHLQECHSCPRWHNFFIKGKGWRRSSKNI